ncbi:6-hydroxymethylpterin diphosphokinase MptE-like protein [Tepidibacillus sp. HK-1]|uniref:6-hydroxymethylpterin diphosphokinase MptE-like protein n=1 Tax=Tepidibacillus sp. HK-1 TaxID=1883407 RepID=UPI000852B872|nr:6-hydroxymethylpterin diphosphokinase MptE-like protein [Tepidibacillus sp. HK-1]GBF12466.1 alpha-2,3-sialyltransferase [Tepidibacillus sp. HK-1]
MTKIDKLNKVLNTLFKIYNLTQNISFFLNLNKHKMISKNVQLKNIDKKECFVIGNGPSLNETDFSLLNDFDTFTVNFFHKGNTNFKFKSTYHVMIDGAFFTNENIDYVLETYRNNRDTKFIFTSKGYNILYKKGLEFDRAYFINQELVQYDDYLKIDMTKNMTASINVVLAAIQCALYMGYKKIYLIGCDFNSYATMKPTHYYDKEAKDRTVPMGVDLQWSALVHYHHYALANYARKNDVEILNATPNSLIDAYERVDFRKLISKV